MLMPTIHVSQYDRLSFLSILFLMLLVATFGYVSHPTHAVAASTRSVNIAKYTNKMVSAPNPYCRVTSGRHIDTVVIHYMSGINVDPARWDNPLLSQQILKASHVSAHYLIDRTGTAYRLVPEQNVAWHAGGSVMPAPDNRHNVNSFSVGIELIATQTSGYTEAQYAALVTLLKGIESRYPIRHIVGHDEISGSRALKIGLRKDLKEDPGPLFDWRRIR